jgi:hypothetical protein
LTIKFNLVRWNQVKRNNFQGDKMKEFKLGDTLCIDVLGNLRFCKVSRVLKRFIELDNGQKITHDGHSYPRRKWDYNSYRIATKKDFELKKYKQLLGKVQKIDTSALSPDQLLAILEIANGE